MPVRTDRGRVAVYRRIWGWPLRSPRHLAVVAITVLVVGGGVALLASAVGDRPTPTRWSPLATSTTARWAPTTTSVPQTATYTTPAVPPVASTPRAQTTTSAPAAPTGPAAASAVAREFMVRWVNHPAGMTSQQWAARLTPYVVPEYVVELESVEPSNISATAVTGEPTVTAATPTVVEVDVATNGGVVHLVVLAQRDGAWLVRSYDLAAG